MERLDRPRLSRVALLIILTAVPLLLLAVATLSPLLTFPAQAAPLAATNALPVVEFGAGANLSVNEGIGTKSISITISFTPTTDVTLSYATQAGTARSGSLCNAGVDYRDATANLVFLANSGPLVQNVQVTICEDTTDEVDEFFYLSLYNVVSATTGVDLKVTILDNDPTPPTPGSTATPQILLDAYEPNNTLSDAFDTAATTAAGCVTADAITLWPTGDVDFFKFWGKAGAVYKVFTDKLDPGIDTVLEVYNTQQQPIPGGLNDDVAAQQRRSEVLITANVTGYYYARIINSDNSNPASKTYCFGVNEIIPPTPTVTSTFTPPEGDECEFNSTLATACLIGPGETKSLDFVPAYGSQQDTDVFRLWVKPGIFYTCETLNLSPVNDTNIILIDGNGNYFNPPIGNDDRAQGDLSSKVEYLATYTGWLYIMVGPVNPPPLSDADQYTYDLVCNALAATPTSTPRPTLPPAPPGSGAGVPTQTPTPFIFPTFPPSPTPIDFSQFATPVQPPPSVQFLPLPTETPAAGVERVASVQLTLYYDLNENFTPELTEGIEDVAVALYDNRTGQLIQFGHTNEAGLLNFGAINVTGAVRVEVPYLNYSQIVVGSSSNILLRIAPRPLPAGIP